METDITPDNYRASNKKGAFQNIEMTKSIINLRTLFDDESFIFFCHFCIRKYGS